MALEAKEFTQPVGPSPDDEEAREFKAQEFQEAERLATKPSVQRRFDELFPNIDNDPNSQETFDQMILDGVFEPNEAGAFLILRQARVSKPHPVELFKATNVSTSPPVIEQKLPDGDPSNFIG